MNPILTSILRTFVPWLVGVLAPLAARWLGLTESDVSAVVAMLIAGLYYLAARLLEQIAPRFGWLLGAPVQPTYTTGGNDSGDTGNAGSGLHGVSADPEVR